MLPLSSFGTILTASELSSHRLVNPCVIGFRNLVPPLAPEFSSRAPAIPALLGRAECGARVGPPTLLLSRHAAVPCGGAVFCVLGAGRLVFRRFDHIFTYKWQFRIACLQNIFFGENLNGMILHLFRHFIVSFGVMS